MNLQQFDAAARDSNNRTETAQFGDSACAHTLPSGWSMKETTSTRVYSLEGGRALVRVGKGQTSPSPLVILVYGQTVYSGYEGNQAGYLSLETAMTRAAATLAEPSSQLTPYGAEVVEQARKRAAEQFDFSRRDAVYALRDAITNLIESTKATNDRGRLAIARAEVAYWDTFTEEEKAYVVVLGREWRRERAESLPVTVRQAELNTFYDVCSMLGWSVSRALITRMQQEVLAGQPEPAACASQGSIH